MIIIGERINGMFGAVGRAIAERDPEPVKRLAVEQARAGAHALDVNTGPRSADPLADMAWLVDTIQGACDLPLSLDSTRTDVIEAGLSRVTRRAIINSTNADDGKMRTVFGMAKRYNAQVIALTMDAKGVPATKDARLELAATIVGRAMEEGLSPADLYLDPILLPVNVAQPQCREVLEALREFRHLSDPAPQTTLGLSNVSQGAKERTLINRTFLTMAMANGLTSAILDPLDTELIDALITASVINNEQIYCDSFREAYRKR